ncbi:MAG: dihydropyrimidinase [Anaerorhabdus sp.]
MIIIKNGTVITEEGQVKKDIAILDNKIVKIEDHIENSVDDEVIDATNKIVFPGFIDGHTHLEMDAGSCFTADSFESGTKAAVVNGTTSIVDFATQSKGQSLKMAYDEWMSKACNNSSCNYRFHMAITDWNDEVKDEILEMEKLGVTSFKMYMAYDNLLSNDQEIYEALKQIKKVDHGLLGVHCENGLLVDAKREELACKNHLDPSAHPLSRPDIVEAEAINRLAYIGKLVGHSVQVVHLSSALGLEEVRKARKNGIDITVETCPQYLLLDDSSYSLANFEGAKYVMSPPLRKKQDQEELLKAIVNNEVNTLATDHCSFNFSKDKELGLNDFRKIPNGSPGIEHRPQLMFTKLVVGGYISLNKFSELMSTNAAKLYGMYPLKGTIKVGSDADIVVWDSEVTSVISQKNQLQNVDYTPYEGFEVKGLASYVILNGKKVVENGKVVKENQGEYILGKKGEKNV